MLSCLPNSYGRFGPLAALEHLPRVGVHALELPIKNAGIPSFFKETPLLTDASSPEDAWRVKQQIEEAGLEISSCNISSGNPLDQAVLARTLSKLELVGQLGVRLVVAGGGEVTSSSDWAQLVANLRQLGAFAAERNITYCCETHPGTCENSARMLELMEAVDHPHVRINFDTGNIFYYNEQPDLLQELRAVLPFVRHIHLKDTNGRYKDWHFPALGEGGAVDFVAVREQLITGGYRGPCSLEIEGIEGEPEPTLPQYEERIAKSVQYLREHCGWNEAE